jgi:hypothetical protein
MTTSWSEPESNSAFVQNSIYLMGTNDMPRPVVAQKGGPVLDFRSHSISGRDKLCDEQLVG